jgi:two-component system, chemotaxis family, protein-glutamate methylesterase/glutaminase
MSRPAFEAIVIGASAGAIDALSVILPPLGAGYPAAIIIVVHLPPTRRSMLVELFAPKCQLVVGEAEDKEPILSGKIYFAPPDYHVLVETDRRFSLSSDEPVNYSRPSIDVLFESASDVFGKTLLGIVLTGANSDGAMGLRTIARAGGGAIVQRPDLAYSDAMPQAAIDACPGAQVMSLEELAIYLQEVPSTR